MPLEGFFLESRSVKLALLLRVFIQSMVFTHTIYKTLKTSLVPETLTIQYYELCVFSTADLINESIYCERLLLCEGHAVNSFMNVEQCWKLIYSESPNIFLQGNRLTSIIYLWNIEHGCFQAMF